LLTGGPLDGRTARVALVGRVLDAPMLPGLLVFPGEPLVVYQECGNHDKPVYEYLVNGAAGVALAPELPLPDGASPLGVRRCPMCGMTAYRRDFDLLSRAQMMDFVLHRIAYLAGESQEEGRDVAALIRAMQERWHVPVPAGAGTPLDPALIPFLDHPAAVDETGVTWCALPGCETCAADGPGASVVVEGAELTARLLAEGARRHLEGASR